MQNTVRRKVLLALLGLAACDHSATGPGSKDQVYGPVVLPAETRVLSSPVLASLSAVSPDLSTLEFTAPDETVRRLSPGHVVVGGVRARTPAGVLRRVTSVETNGGVVTVHTATATLEDAIKDADIQMQRTLTPGDVVSAAPAVRGITLRRSSNAVGGNFSIVLDTLVLYDKDGDTSTRKDQVAATGTISFDPTVDMQLSIHKLQVQRVRFAAKLATTSQIEILSQVGVHAGKDVLLARYTFQPIVVMVGPVPVVILPVLEIRLGVDGELSAGVNTGFSYDVTAEAAAEYTSGKWTATTSLDKSAHALPVRAFGGVTVEGYIAAPLTLNLYGAAGPYAAPRIFMEFSADPFAAPWWTLDWGVRMEFGVRSSLLGRTLDDFDVPAAIEYRDRLAQAAGAFDGSVQVTLRPDTTTLHVGETQRLQATVMAGTDTIPGLPIQWSSSALSVATVDSVGTVSAVGVGTATISAAVRGGSTTSSVRVVARDTAAATVRWRFVPPAGEIVDFAVGPSGNVYVVAGTPGSVRSRLYAVDRETGQVLWSAGDWETPRSGAVVGDDETVYLTGTNGLGRHEFIAAFDGHSGQVKWSSSTSGAIGRFHYPVLGQNGRVFVPSTSGGGGTGDGSIWGFDAASGASLWYSVAPEWPQWAEIGAVGQNGTVYAAADSSLYAIRGSDGGTAWRFIVGPRNGYQNVMLPPAIGPDGSVYISALGGARPLVALDGATGALRWRVDDCRMSGLVLDGAGQLLCAGDGLMAVSASSGGRLWAFREGQGAIHSVVAASGNTVLALSGGTPYTLFGLDGTNGTPRWQWTNVPSGEPRGYLALLPGGRVYVGFRFQLVALSTALGGPAASSWPMLQHDAAKSSRAR